MKYKIIGIVMAAVMVAAAFLALPMETVEQTGGRIHQHLSSERIPAVTVTGVSFVLIFPW